VEEDRSGMATVLHASLKKKEFLLEKINAFKKIKVTIRSLLDKITIITLFVVVIRNLGTPVLRRLKIKKKKVVSKIYKKKPRDKKKEGLKGKVNIICFRA